MNVSENVILHSQMKLSFKKEKKMTHNVRAKNCNVTTQLPLSFQIIKEHIGYLDGWKKKNTHAAS